MTSVGVLRIAVENMPRHNIRLLPSCNGASNNAALATVRVHQWRTGSNRKGPIQRRHPFDTKPNPSACFALSRFICIAFSKPLMSIRSIGLSDVLHRYLLDTSLREPDVMRRLREETAQHPESNMQIAPEQGQFMQLLVRLVGAERTLEVGTFTGYSALAVALTLPDDGQLVACDVSEDYTRVARRYWQKAGVAHKVDLRIGPAVDTLDTLLNDGQAGSFDFAFIDADKTGYDAYYERSLQLVRSGGLIMLDNMLRSGRVVDPDPDDASTQAIHRLNEKLHRDDRIHLSLIPVADGLTLALKT